MREIEDAEDLRLAVAMLRALRGWSRAELAEAAGVGVRTVSRYESGAQTPSWGTFEQIVAAVGVPLLLVDGLLGWISMARAALSGRSDPGPAFGPLAEATAELTHAIRQLVRSALEGSDLWDSGPPGETDRRNAAELWAVLEPYPLKDQLFLVEAASEYHRWALCELICDRSLAAADQPGRAVELAELAVRVAELTPGGESWKQRTRGYALAHLAEAHRAAGDPATARDLMDRARVLWEAGKAADPGLFDSVRLAELAVRLPEP